MIRNLPYGARYKGDPETVPVKGTLTITPVTKYIKVTEVEPLEKPPTKKVLSGASARLYYDGKHVGNMEGPLHITESADLEPVHVLGSFEVKELVPVGYTVNLEASCVRKV